MSYTNTIRRYKYCSHKCFGKDKEINKIRQKHKQETNIKKYGVLQIFQNNQIKNKINNIKQKKYGNKVVSKNNKIKNKISTALKQYYNLNGIIKHQQNFKKKYGVKNPLQVPQIKQKIIKNNIQKYQVKYPNFKSSYQNLLKYKNLIIPLFQLKQYQGYDKLYKWKCVKCGNIFQSKIYSTSFFKQFQRLPRCLKCYPLHQHFSNEQKQLMQFCKQYYPNLIQNDRNLIKPYQLDIVIPEIKLAIQFNGLYWHSIDKMPLGFHLMKTELCQKKDYRLIHIWQHKWLNAKDKIKQKLQQIFLKKEKISYYNNIKFDRCWYQLKNIKGYKYIIEKPEIIIVDNFKYQNCGYILYQKE